MAEPTHVDAAFPLVGKSLPLDHGYLLFSAVSRILPALHERKAWGLHPVLGRRVGPGQLELIGSSALKVRLPVSELGAALQLAGKTLEVAGNKVTVGVPKIFPLEPKPTLKSRFVTIKHHAESEVGFAAAIRQHLGSLKNLGQAPATIDVQVGPRRVIKVGDHTIVGFPVMLTGLLAQASLSIQQEGIGGRRHMGAGIFVPESKTKR
jgi:CRISPR-associated protein Cas6